MNDCECSSKHGEAHRHMIWNITPTLHGTGLFPLVLRCLFIRSFLYWLECYYTFFIMRFFTANCHLNLVSFSNKSPFPNETRFGLINGRSCESLMWSQVSAPVFHYASFRESSNCIHMNQDTDPQGIPEPDFRFNLVSRRRTDWAIPRFSSACTRADKLLNSDVDRSLQTSCWVWERERRSLVLQVAISVWIIWNFFHSTESDKDFWAYPRSKIQSWRTDMTLQSWCDLLKRQLIGWFWRRDFMRPKTLSRLHREIHIIKLMELISQYTKNA
jgi:hypothetical protein